MRSRTEKGSRKQGVEESAFSRVRQSLLSMVAGMAATKRDLLEWVQEVGLEALADVLVAIK